MRFIVIAILSLGCGVVAADEPAVGTIWSGDVSCGVIHYCPEENQIFDYSIHECIVPPPTAQEQIDALRLRVAVLECMAAAAQDNHFVDFDCTAAGVTGLWVE